VVLYHAQYIMPDRMEQEEMLKKWVGKKRGDLPWIETHFDEAFRQEILHFPQIQLPQIYKQLEHCQGQKEIFIFHTRQEADAYLAALSR